MNEDEVVVEVGEFCNKIITDEKGTKIYFDKALLRGVIEMLEVMEVRGTSDG